MDNRELYSQMVKTRSKVFFFDLKENLNGRFLKVTEKSGDKRNTIMIPEEGLEEFVNALQSMLHYKGEE